MTEWNLRRLQQLSVMAMNHIAEELKEPAMTMAERRHKAGLAQFVIRQQSRVDERKTKHIVDVPSMLIGAQSVALIAERISQALGGDDVKKERDSVIGEYTVVERDDTELVNELENPVPKFGQLNVDWDTGRLQCHVCNGFYASVSSHISSAHNVSTEEYRQIYGIQSDIPLSFDRLKNECDVDHIAWRGKRMAIVDAEKNLRPYDEPVEPEDDTADSGGVEEVASGLGNELSEPAEKRRVGLH
jgi:hypothetical protein